MSACSPQLTLASPAPLDLRARALADLLHAINQPITALQFSLELGLASPRSREDCVRSLREGLEHTCRIRILMQAIRELLDFRCPDASEMAPCLLDAVLLNTADELRPVAEARGVSLKAVAFVPLWVRTSRDFLASLLFRVLESAISQTSDGGKLEVVAVPDQKLAVLRLSWEPERRSERSSFSSGELGLFLARAAWELAGGSWIEEPRSSLHPSAIRLSLPSSMPDESSEQGA